MIGTIRVKTGARVLAIALAAGVGAQGILVRTGYGDAIARQYGDDVPEASFVARDLMGAVAWILERQAHAQEAV